MSRTLALGPALIGAGLLAFPAQSVDAGTCAMLDGNNVVVADDPMAGSCRTVGLYGSRSGFAKARLDRKSITVGPLPGHLDTPENYEILDLALDEWNRAAGWEIFKPDFDGSPTDVSFHVNHDPGMLVNGRPASEYGAWVDWDMFETGWYEHCYVWTNPWGPVLKSNWAHELGHCLGFVDVETTDTGYVGIMCYCRRGDLWPNNSQDMASLAEAGYRDPYVCVE